MIISTKQPRNDRATVVGIGAIQTTDDDTWEQL